MVDPQSVREMMQEGLSDRQIAAVLKLTVGSVRSIRCRHGWLRSRSPSRTRRLLALYREGRSVAEIARALKIAPACVRRRLRQAGLEVR